MPKAIFNELEKRARDSGHQKEFKNWIAEYREQ